MGLEACRKVLRNNLRVLVEQAVEVAGVEPVLVSISRPVVVECPEACLEEWEDSLSNSPTRTIFSRTFSAPPILSLQEATDRTMKVVSEGEEAVFLL